MGPNKYGKEKLPCTTEQNEMNEKCKEKMKVRDKKSNTHFFL